jgi:hypothetical protein
VLDKNLVEVLLGLVSLILVVAAVVALEMETP